MTLTSSPASPVYRRSWGQPIEDAEERKARLEATRKRAAAHQVAGVLPGPPAAPAGFIPPSGVVPADILTTIEAAIADRQARLLGMFPLLHFGPSLEGWPQLPLITLPTAGKQVGEKLEATSQKFDIVADPNAVTIDSAAYLNVSAQLERSVPGVVARLLHLAVVAQAEVEVVGAIEAAGGNATDLATALAHFNAQALWSPTLVVTPPGKLTKLSVDVLTLQAAGIGIAVTTAATKTTVLDPLAISGALAVTDLSAPEAAVLGNQVGSGIFGRVSANPAGVASATIP